MKPLNKVIRGNRDVFYNKHLEIANAALSLGLTPTEIKVLAAFMLLQGDIAEDRFGTTARKLVKAKLSLSDGGLGNYLDAFKKKKVVQGIGKDTHIVQSLFPKGDNQLYTIKLVLEE